MPYNNDLFADRKCVHVRIKAHNLERFRVELLKRRLSMQEVFDEAASLVALSDPGMLKILDKIVYNKNKEKMDRILKSDAKPTEAQARKISPRPKPVPQGSTEESFFNMLENVNPLNKET